jgi:hypothetical protein
MVMPRQTTSPFSTAMSIDFTAAAIACNRIDLDGERIF